MNLVRFLKYLLDRQKKLTPAEELELAKREARRQARLERWMGRSVDTSHGGPNMPKHQPCPECGAWVKRDDKTMGGAQYKCRGCHSTFFVKAPGTS